MSSSDGKILDLYNGLLARFGRQEWWHADSAFEVAIGALLTQQTTWSNVEKAIANLKNAKLMEPLSLSDAPLRTVKKLMRCAGFYNQKSERVKHMAKHVMKNHNGRIEELLKRPLHEARSELLSLNGVGYETADSILLYGGNRLIFPIDAYTRRVCQRTGIADETDYERLRTLFEACLPRRARAYKEMHALIVELAKAHCKTRPVCNGCPVRECKVNKIFAK